MLFNAVHSVIYRLQAVIENEGCHIEQGFGEPSKRLRRFNLPHRFFRALILYWIILLIYATLKGGILEKWQSGNLWAEADRTLELHLNICIEQCSSANNKDKAS
ncbi:hypothetical protein LAZ67_3001474 [Cordylochernes scorpioides]|uniref:Uncharacterized protein n=1 Tax=Cordylochernes scorpioides TaxID=51811 RepID=A0ABY6K6Z6_9ARAC|nr:hypothetical protein LAZ67_3001474 [Cordylochernes scorpioides]